MNRCIEKTLQDYQIKVSRSRIIDILSDPAMLGKFYAYRTKNIQSLKGRRKVATDEKDWLLVYEDPAQAILSPEQFSAIKKRLQLNRENSSRHTIHWYPPLRSLVFHDCGRRMVGHYNDGQPNYRCRCCEASIKARPLWEAVKEGLGKMLLDPKRLIPGIKAQLNGGDHITDLEERLKSVRQRIGTLDEAEQKALRLYLYLSNYPPEKLDVEINRIKEQREKLNEENVIIEKELTELRQAIVDEDGLRRFCELASNNLDTLDEAHWRLLLEMMRLQVWVEGDDVRVKVAVPAMKDTESNIVLSSCPRVEGGKLFKKHFR